MIAEQPLPEILTPDLTATALHWNPQDSISDGENVVFTATITNAGAGSTLRSFHVRFEVDGNLIERQQVSGLASGESVEVVMAWPAVAGSGMATVIADEYDAITESDEGNNELPLPLPGIPAPDFTVSNIR